MRAKPLRFVVLLAALVVSVAFSLCIGTVWIPFGEIVTSLAGSGDQLIIVRDLRLPRILLAAMAGGGLAAAGAAYQGLFRNPLADPFIIGSASGSALGATIVLILGLNAGAMGLTTISAGAFVGSLVATAIVFSMAAIGRSMNLTRLLLAGTAIGSAMNALAWILLILGDKPIALIVSTLLGSFVGRGWPDVYAALPWMFVGISGLIAMSRSLDALAAGDEVARGLGLRVRLAVALVMTFAGLLVASSVAVGGVIGFVGLVAPYLARAIVGHRHLLLIPASTIVGAILLLLSDTFARSILSSSELPVGVISALLACPFFLFVLKRVAL
ncbi:MAG: iron ABC transporter permease [Gemmataceae bacterium]